MPIALVNNNRGTTTTATAGFDEPIDLPAGASITVGNTLVLVAAFDNVTIGGAGPNMYVTASAAVTTQTFDVRGNLWRRVSRQLYDPGIASEGCIVEVWMCNVQFPYSNGDDIFVQWSDNMANAVLRISEFSGIRRITTSIVTPTTGTGTGTAATAPAISPGVTGRLVIGAMATEGSAVITGDADTTDGSWVTLVNNTIGAGATGMTGFAQYKIVTGTSAQNWSVTWTGSQDWAATAMVFDVYASDPQDEIPGNPNYPCVAGAEILPINYATLPVDTGTCYDFLHTIDPDLVGTYDYAATSVFEQPPTTSQHTVAYEMYDSGNETPNDEIVTLTFNLSAAAGTATASSGTLLAALQTPGGAYVTFDSNTSQNLTMNFSTGSISTDYANWRVVRFGVRYLAWKDDSSNVNSVGEGLNFQFGDSQTGAFIYADHGFWLVPDYQRDADYVTRWYGETNQLNRYLYNTLGYGNGPNRAPFSIADIANLASGTNLRVIGLAGTDSSQRYTYMDYIQLVVEVAPERRMAASHRFVTNSSKASSAPSTAVTFGFGHQPVLMLDPATSFYNRASITASSGEYVMRVREALPASPSDYYRVRTSGTRDYSFAEATGPSLALQGFSQPRETLAPLPDVKRGTYSGGVLAGQLEDLDQYVTSAMGYDLGMWNVYGSFWTAYERPGTISTQRVYTGNPVTTVFSPQAGSTTDAVKVLVKSDPLNTADLTITVEQPLSTVLATGTLTVAAWEAGTDLGDGWREVIVPLNTTATLAALTTNVPYIRLASTTTLASPWFVSTAYPVNGEGDFGYLVGYNTNDVAAVVLCPISAPEVLVFSELATFDDSGPCADTTVQIPCFSLVNSTDYSSVSVERSIDGGITYSPVGIFDPSNFGSGTSSVYDTFTRTVSPGFGTADSGQSWTLDLSSAGAVASVGSGLGQFNLSPAGNSYSYYKLSGYSITDFDFRIDTYPASTVTGDSMYTDFYFHGTATDAFGTGAYNNVSFRYKTDGTVFIYYVDYDGVSTSLYVEDQLTLPGWTAGSPITMRVLSEGTNRKAKAWLTGDPEPEEWNIDITASYTAAGSISIGGFKASSNTSASKIVYVDNLQLDAEPDANWCDLGVPWDVEDVTYRVTGYRDSDRRSSSSTVVWSGLSANPGAAFGLVDYESGTLYSYVPVSDGDLELTYSPLNPADTAQIHGVDYQVALRSPEERGLAISVVVAVQNFSSCALGDDAALDDFAGENTPTPGSKSMTPTPFNALRAMDQTSRLQLNLPGGHTRFVSVNVGSLSIRTVQGVYLGELDLTDVVIPEIDPYS